MRDLVRPPATDDELGELREWIGEGCPQCPSLPRMIAVAEVALDELLVERALARAVVEDLVAQHRRLDALAAAVEARVPR